KDVPAKSAVYVEESSLPAALIQAVEKEIKDAGFAIVSAEKDADFRLKDIKQIKAPVRGTGVEATIKSTISPARGLVLNSTSELTTHISIVEPIGPEAEGCRASLQHVGEDISNPYRFVALADVAMIAQF